MNRCAQAIVGLIGAGTIGGASAAQSGLYPGGDGASGRALVGVRLVSEHASVPVGGESTLAIVLDIRDGWHTYWLNPGDSGAPISVTFDAPESVTMGEVQWPAPERYLYSGGIALDYVYTGRTTLLVPVRVSADGPAGEVTINARIEYLACEETCIPGEAEAQATFTVGPSGGAAVEHIRLFADARALLAKPVDENVVIAWIGRTLTMEVRGATSVRYFPLSPRVPRPEDAIRDGAGEGDTLTVVYPDDIVNAQRVQGVLEASIRDETRLYTIDIGPPGRD